MSNYELVQIM